MAMAPLVSATARPRKFPAAIAKGVEEAKKEFFKVPRIQGTIPTRSRERLQRASSCCDRPPPVPV
jgi:ribosomal protein S5